MNVARPAQRVLGLDPSLRATGLAVVETADGQAIVVARETARCPSAWPHSRCLRKLREIIEKVINESRPSAAAIESLFFSRNVRTAMALGEARGVILAACASRDVPVFEYAPREVKRAVTGHGGATKEQVRRMIRVLTGFAGEMSEDESDALAVALCHAHRFRGAHRDAARSV